MSEKLLRPTINIKKSISGMVRDILLKNLVCRHWITSYTLTDSLYYFR